MTAIRLFPRGHAAEGLTRPEQRGHAVVAEAAGLPRFRPGKWWAFERPGGLRVFARMHFHARGLGGDGRFHVGHKLPVEVVMLRQGE